MSPPQLIPPTSPVRLSPGTEDSGGGFRGTGHDPFRALIISNLKWESLVAATTYFPHTEALSGLDKARPQPQTTIIFPGTKDSYTHFHHPVRWPYRRRPHLLK